MLEKKNKMKNYLHSIVKVSAEKQNKNIIKHLQTATKFTLLYRFAKKVTMKIFLKRFGEG